MDVDQNWTEMDDYTDDMAAQNAVEDSKYDFPEQEEPSDLDCYQQGEADELEAWRESEQSAGRLLPDPDPWSDPYRTSYPWALAGYSSEPPF